MDKGQAYLELVKEQNNLKLVEIEESKIARISSSVSDNISNKREDILENHIVSDK